MHKSEDLIGYIVEKVVRGNPALTTGCMAYGEEEDETDLKKDLMLLRGKATLFKTIEDGAMHMQRTLELEREAGNLWVEKAIFRWVPVYAHRENGSVHTGRHNQG